MTSHIKAKLNQKMGRCCCCRRRGSQEEPEDESGSGGGGCCCCGRRGASITFALLGVVFAAAVITGPVYVYNHDQVRFQKYSYTLTSKHFIPQYICLNSLRWDSPILKFFYPNIWLALFHWETLLEQIATISVLVNFSSFNYL